MVDIVKNIDKNYARYFSSKNWQFCKKIKIRCSDTDFPELWKLVNLSHGAYITF